MKTFLSQTTLERRLNKCRQTIVSKISEGVLVPDGVVITGGKQSLVFDSERLPELRRAVAAGPKEVA